MDHHRRARTSHRVPHHGASPRGRWFRNTVNFALVNVDTGLHEYTRIERAAYATKRVKYKMRSSMLATEFWGAMYPPFHARHSQYAAEMAQRIRNRLETSPAWQLPQVS